MNHEDYVSFEQAKALKELGFDWDCGAYYYTDTKEFRGNISPDNHNYRSEIVASAPTLYQAQKWLREKYKLWLETVICITNVNQYSCDIYDLKTADEDGYMDGPTTDIEGTFNTPEQSLSAGIDKAIELLKQQNNGK